jgi:integrase
MIGAGGHVRVQWENHDLVFPNSSGRYLRADKVLRAFKAVLRSAGLPERRLHDLRHTYATDLYAADVHPRLVHELLGHSRLDMTNNLFTQVRCLTLCAMRSNVSIGRVKVAEEALVM